MFRCSVTYTHLADTLKLIIANYLATHLRCSQQTNPQHHHCLIPCKQFTWEHNITIKRITLSRIFRLFSKVKKKIKSHCFSKRITSAGNNLIRIIMLKSMFKFSSCVNFYCSSLVLKTHLAFCNFWIQINLLVSWNFFFLLSCCRKRLTKF